MEKQYRSSITKNHKIIKKKYIFSWRSLKRLRNLLSYFRFYAKNQKKHCGKTKRLMTLKFRNITNMLLFSIMSSSDVMFETFFCVFQYVNEQTAHVKIDRDSRRCRPGP